MNESFVVFYEYDDCYTIGTISDKVKSITKSEYKKLKEQNLESNEIWRRFHNATWDNIDIQEGDLEIILLEINYLFWIKVWIDNMEDSFPSLKN